jgi:hypothetical protein
MEITKEEYEKAKATVRSYELQEYLREIEYQDEDFQEPEPCSVCGDVDGMVNQCCVGYDPLHYKNCGYG